MFEKIISLLTDLIAAIKDNTAAIQASGGPTEEKRGPGRPKKNTTPAADTLALPDASASGIPSIPNNAPAAPVSSGEVVTLDVLRKLGAELQGLPGGKDGVTACFKALKDSSGQPANVDKIVGLTKEQEALYFPQLKQLMEAKKAELSKPKEADPFAM